MHDSQAYRTLQHNNLTLHPEVKWISPTQNYLVDNWKNRILDHSLMPKILNLKQRRLSPQVSTVGAKPIHNSHSDNQKNSIFDLTEIPWFHVDFLINWDVESLPVCWDWQSHAWSSKKTLPNSLTDKVYPILSSTLIQSTDQWVSLLQTLTPQPWQTLPGPTLVLNFKIIDHPYLFNIPSLSWGLTTNTTCPKHNFKFPKCLLNQNRITNRDSPTGLTPASITKRASPTGLIQAPFPRVSPKLA